jgi:phage terminase large subunit-like protein
MAVLYVIVCLAGNYGEALCAANDQEQAVSRVFQAIARIIEASPLLRDSAKITANRIEFTATNATIIAIASDYAGAAGSNPSIVCFDELWAYTSEKSRRLWDELVPVPTRKVSVRLTVTYAGFEGESETLEELYKRGIQGEEIAPSFYRSKGMLMFWSHRPIAPWQTPEWVEQMRDQLRPAAFIRQIENRFVSSESGFVDPEWWAGCVDADLRPELAAPSLEAWVGIDASVKRDSTAIVVVSYDYKSKRVRLAWHRIFQPSSEDPLDFEVTIEKTLLELHRRFYLRQVRFDPYQLVAVAQRLALAGLPMLEFAQTQGNLTEASNNLFELIKGRNLWIYPDDEIDLAIQRAVAVETSRGWRISKAVQSHKIDFVVALAQAALGAVQGASGPWVVEYRGASPRGSFTESLRRSGTSALGPPGPGELRDTAAEQYANDPDWEEMPVRPNRRRWSGL